MSSLKMTFSLASLVLLMAFAFTAMPVMAHVLEGNPTDHAAADDAHPVVKSITAPKWTDGTPFNVTVVFEAANTAKKISLPTESLVSGDVTISNGTGVFAPPGGSLTTQTFTVTSTGQTTFDINARYAYTPAVPTAPAVDSS